LLQGLGVGPDIGGQDLNLGRSDAGKLRDRQPQDGKAPTSTRTIEITMATMGRLIKNFDIGLPSVGFRRKWLGVHLHARAHLLHALGHHPLPWFQSVRNNPLVADTVADFDGRMLTCFRRRPLRLDSCLAALRLRAAGRAARPAALGQQREPCRNRRDAEYFRDWETAQRAELPRCSH
jgi:hypothetical protein